MTRVFAIGDIHGCSKTFKKLVLEKIKIQKPDKIYCIGDYIDRGPDSQGVVDFILKLRKNGYQIHTLRGNHEQIMLDSIESEIKFKHWIKNGGDTTLKSFGVSSYSKLKPNYRNFFGRTKHFIQSRNSIFVHAGLNFQRPNPLEDKDAMLWIRDFPIDKQKLGERIIIHGHTPKPLDFILSQRSESILNIDGGCVYNDIKGYGNLIALNITEKKWVTVKNIE